MLTRAKRELAVRRAGLGTLRQQPLTFGVCVVTTAMKPSAV